MAASWDLDQGGDLQPVASGFGIRTPQQRGCSLAARSASPDDQKRTVVSLPEGWWGCELAQGRSGVTVIRSLSTSTNTPAGLNRPRGAYRVVGDLAYTCAAQPPHIDIVGLFGTAADHRRTAAANRRTLIYLSFLEPPQTAAKNHARICHDRLAIRVRSSCFRP
jgi:hypothetical protein